MCWLVNATHAVELAEVDHSTADNVEAIIPSGTKKDQAAGEGRASVCSGKLHLATRYSHFSALVCFGLFGDCVVCLFVWKQLHFHTCEFAFC